MGILTLGITIAGAVIRLKGGGENQIGDGLGTLIDFFTTG